MTKREWYDALDGLDQRIFLSLAKVGYSFEAIKDRYGTDPWKSERVRRARLLAFDEEFMASCRAKYPGVPDATIISGIKNYART